MQAARPESFIRPCEIGHLGRRAAHGILCVMGTYTVTPGRRAGDGWLVVLHSPGEALAVIRSFATFAEARAEADRLADTGPNGANPAGEAAAATP